MSRKLPRIKLAEPVIHGVLKLEFLDGYEGMVDPRPRIAKGGIFEWLRRPENVARVQVDEYGRSITWIDDSGYDIDLCGDSLRSDCERQAEVQKLMTA